MRLHSLSRQKMVLFVCCIILFSVFSIGKIYASSTTMLFNPKTGSIPVNVSTTVDLIINGNGDQFNAAKATVTPSSNLWVQNLTLGNCNFAFINTPSNTNPSFVGVLLGASSTYCTLYSMTIYPLSAGPGIIKLSNAEVKQFGTGNDVLIGLQDADFTVLPPAGSNPGGNNGGGNPGTTPNPTTVLNQIPTPTSTPAPPDSVTIQTYAPDNKPLVGATVILDPPQSVFIPSAYSRSGNANPPTIIPQTQASAPLTAVTDVKGTAVFTHVPQGLHKIMVEQGNQELAQNILMVNGRQPVNLGIKAPAKQNILLGVVLAILGLLVFLGILFCIIRFTPFYTMIKNKIQKSPQQTEQPPTM